MEGLAILGIVILAAIAFGRLGGSSRSGGGDFTKDAYDPKRGDVKPNNIWDDSPTANGSQSGAWWATPEHDPRNQRPTRTPQSPAHPPHWPRQ